MKEVRPAENLAQLVTLSAKLNFKVAGPKLGGDVKDAAARLTALDPETLRKFALSGKLSLDLGSRKVELGEEDVQIIRNENEGFAVESENQLTVALVTKLTDDLIDEGFAREVVNKVQNMRKSSGFDVTDHIMVSLSATDRLVKAAKRFDDFIRKETLAERIDVVLKESLTNGTEWNINGEPAAIAVTRVKP